MRGVAVGAFWTVLQTGLGVVVVYLVERKVTTEDLLSVFVIALGATGLFVILTHLPIWRRTPHGADGGFSISGNVAGGNQIIHRVMGLIAISIGGHQQGERGERRRTVRRADDRAKTQRWGVVGVGPSIKLRKIQDAIQLFDKGGKPIYSLIQVWFEGMDETLHELSGEVIVQDHMHRYSLRRALGRWAIGTDVANVGGWAELQLKIELAPGGLAKLNIFRRYPNERVCYLFADGVERINERQVFYEESDVTISLKAIGFERKFRFRLLNDEKTYALTVES